MSGPLELVPLDLEALMDDAAREGREGTCAACEFAADDEPAPTLLLCWCGVCFRYHHDPYFHEPIDDQVVP